MATLCEVPDVLTSAPALPITNGEPAAPSSDQQPSKVTRTSMIQSAMHIALNLSVEQVDTAERTWGQYLEQTGCADREVTKPAAMVASASRVSALGHDLLPIFFAQARLLQLEGNRKTFQSLSSALKAWHGFA